MDLMCWDSQEESEAFNVQPDQLTGLIVAPITKKEEVWFDWGWGCWPGAVESGVLSWMYYGGL